MLDSLLWTIGLITVSGSFLAIGIGIVMCLLEHFQVFGKEDTTNDYLHELWLEDLSRKSMEEKFLPQNRISKYYSQPPSDN